MNPFQEHAANMKAYEAMTSEPVNGQEGNYVEYPYGSGAFYTAIVGPFTMRQVLVAGGFSPRLMAEVIIQKDILPASVEFRSGQKIRAVQVGGEGHDCQVESVDGTFTEWRLQLWDVNEKA